MTPLVLSFGIVLPFVSAVQIQSQYKGAHLPPTASFDEYTVAFARDYHEAEHGIRKQLFHKRAAKIRAHNENPKRWWTAGFNELTDRTDEELSALRGWRRTGRRQQQKSISLLADANKTQKLPLEVDWRNLTSIKTPADQGPCGSCWAFAASAMLTARYEIEAGKPKFFSPQQLVNCVKNEKHCGGSGGCDGATVELAMDYVKTIGLDNLGSLDEAPYSARDETCKDTASLLEVEEHSFWKKWTSKTSKSDKKSRRRRPWSKGQKWASWHKKSSSWRSGPSSASVLAMTHWETLPSNEALPLMMAVMQGPVAISVAASEWFMYRSGVFNGCPKDAVIDHAVLLTGYGVEDSTGAKRNYWTIRNSWGPNWGEGGFIRMFRDATPQDDEAFCGIDHDPSVGIACEPYPDQVEVCGMCGMLYDSVVSTIATQL